ncbi:MAG: hypothetical protein PHC75_05570 [Burkholderiales bacterium]|nr:hypothetical protein [Burkholderiales bacterium]
MKKYFSLRSSIAYSILSLSLVACNGGGEQSGNWQDVNTDVKNQTLLLNTICGDDGVNSFVIQEASGEPVSTSFNLGKSRGVRSVIQCVNGAQFDVTSAADWSSSDHEVFTVDNQSSKGYVSPLNMGSAYLFATYLDGSYVAKYNINVVDAALKSIALSIGRANNQLASGETIPTIVSGAYSDKSNALITDATLVSSDNSIIKVSGQNIIGVKTGTATITATSGNFSSKITVEVLNAAVKGLVLNSDNQTEFTTGIPQTVTLRAKLALTDGSLIDIPQSTVNAPSMTQCKLQKDPNDTNISFVTSGNGCTITSTTESGQNRVVYSYSILGSNNQVTSTFESNIIVKSTDNDIKDLLIDLDSNIKNGGMIVGDVYRYHIYAVLKNGKQVDVTKSIPLKHSMLYQNSDVSDKVVVGDTGYIGSTSNSFDDGKGGVIKLTDYIIKNDTAQKTVRLSLNASLSKFSANFTKDIVVMSNILTVSNLSDYFAKNIYPKLNSSDKKGFKTFSGFNSDGTPIFNDYTSMFVNLKDDQLSASKISDINASVNLESVGSQTIEMMVDTTIPRINKIHGSDDASMSIATIGCNMTSSPRTITTASINKIITETNTVSRGLTIGVEQTVEIGFSLAKSITKFSLSGNKTWSDTKTNTQTYTLSPQNVLLESYGKALVVQKVFKTNIGLTGKFSLPLTANSCIPFTINGSLNGFNLSSPACIKYQEISSKPSDVIFNNLFDGSNTLTFFANYNSDSITEAQTNTVAVYVYYPGDVGYDSISCQDSILNTTGLKSAKTTQDNVLFKNNTVSQNGKKIPLSMKNLTKVQTVSK